MAIYKKGADPVALRASAERITGHARECETSRVRRPAPCTPSAASGAARTSTT